MAIALVAINKKGEKYKVVFTISRLCDKRTNDYSPRERPSAEQNVTVSNPGQTITQCL